MRASLPQYFLCEVDRLKSSSNWASKCSPRRTDCWRYIWCSRCSRCGNHCTCHNLCEVDRLNSAPLRGAWFPSPGSRAPRQLLLTATRGARILRGADVTENRECGTPNSIGARIFPSRYSANSQSITAHCRAALGEDAGGRRVALPRLPGVVRAAPDLFRTDSYRVPAETTLGAELARKTRRALPPLRSHVDASLSEIRGAVRRATRPALSIVS